jgi:hypothetical protein
MKNLFLSAIFVVVAFASNAQVITINVFETLELKGFSQDDRVGEIIQNSESGLLIDTIPYSFTYEIDFNTKTCVLKDAVGNFIGKARFVVKTKYSDRNFQIEFISTEEGALSGIVVTPNSSAYYIDDTMLIYCTIFKTLYIF